MFRKKREKKFINAFEIMLDNVNMNFKKVYLLYDWTVLESKSKYTCC